VLAGALADPAKPQSEATKQELARAVVRDTSRHYVSSRRDRVDTFIDRHFALSGSLALHPCSLGWDFVRSPLNLFLTDLIAATTGGVVIVGAALTAFSGVRSSATPPRPPPAAAPSPARRTRTVPMR